MYKVAERAAVNATDDADITHQNPGENGAIICFQLEPVVCFFTKVEIL
jgi:hypothetical protein